MSDAVLTTEESLEQLKNVIQEKDSEYQLFQNMYPHVKKAIESYGDKMHGFHWYNNRATFQFEKYGTSAPQGFLTFLERVGLNVKTVGRDTGRYFEVEVEGVNDVGTN